MIVKMKEKKMGKAQIGAVESKEALLRGLKVKVRVCTGNVQDIVEIVSHGSNTESSHCQGES